MNKELRHKKILDESIKFINYAVSAWRLNSEKFRNNLDFVLGYQNDDANTFRPVNEVRMTWNVLYPYIKTIMGEQLQNSPSVNLRAASKDIPDAEVALQSGIINGIFYDSHFDKQTYEVFFNQLAGGYGAYLVHPEYEGNMSFDQNIKVTSQQDPTLCFWDMDAEDASKITGKFCGKFKALTQTEFKELYPDVNVKEGFPVEDIGINPGIGITREQYVVFCELWKKEYKKATIVQLSDGTIIEKDDLEKYQEKLKQEHSQRYYLNTLNNIQTPEMEIPTIVKSKTERIYKIKYYKMLRSTILEEKEWPGNLLPLVYVDGDSAKRRGRVEIKSFCQFAHDPQRFLNYVKNQQAQQIKNFRREQWLGTPENVAGKGIKEMWQNPEEQKGILLANPDSRGQMPQKVPPSQISPDIVQAGVNAVVDIQNILGRHEAAQGAQAPEVSGIALSQRIQQDNMGSYLQIDNLCHAIVAVGEICIDMIPSIYDSERDIVTRDDKNQGTPVTINKFNPTVDTSNNQEGLNPDEQAEQSYFENQVKQRNFRVELSAGPSFAIQKQNEFNKLLQFMQVPPSPYVNALIDKVAENIDLPNTNQIVQRVRSFVPPELLIKSGEMTPEEQEQYQQQQAQQAQQGPPPEIQLLMQKNQIEMQKLQMQQQELQQKAQNDQTQNYLTGLQTQVDFAKIDQQKAADQMTLQKQIIQANTELKAAAMNGIHNLHKLTTEHQAQVGT